MGATGLGVGAWEVGGGGQTIREATGVGVGGPKRSGDQTACVPSKLASYLVSCICFLMALTAVFVLFTSPGKLTLFNLLVIQKTSLLFLPINRTMKLDYVFGAIGNVTVLASLSVK